MRILGIIYADLRENYILFSSLSKTVQVIMNLQGTTAEWYM